MTKSFLIVAGCLMIAPAAWAQVATAPQGAGNNANAALSAPAPAPAPAPAASATTAQKVQNATPGSTGANNVATTLAPPADPAPAPSAAASATASNRTSTGYGSAAPGSVASAQMGGQAQMGAQTQAFNAGAYATSTECLNAAAAAQAPLSQCSGRPAK